MKINEIKKTVEEVVSIEYIAEDGTVFYNEHEAKEYEASALFAVSKNLKKLNTKWASIYDLTEEGSEECALEIFDIQTQEDLENLRRYVYLTLTKNGASESTIKSCFTADNEYRKSCVIDNVTMGHEVLLCWSYDGDWVWTYYDGSLEGYFKWLRDKYNKIVTPIEPEVKPDQM